MKTFKPFYVAVFNIMMAIASVLQILLYPVRVLGREHMPRGGGFVLAPNHWRAMDPVMIVLSRRFAPKMLIMGKDSLFGRNAFLDFFWDAVGAFPIRRGVGDKAVIDKASAEIAGGRGVLIFPEGTRSGDGEKLSTLKSGAFVVALQAGVPVIPCRIWYKAGKLCPFCRTTIMYGPPVTTAQLGLPESGYTPATLREAKRRYRKILEDLYLQHEDKL